MSAWPPLATTLYIRQNIDFSTTSQTEQWSGARTLPTLYCVAVQSVVYSSLCGSSLPGFRQSRLCAEQRTDTTITTVQGWTAPT